MHALGRTADAVRLLLPEGNDGGGNVLSGLVATLGANHPDVLIAQTNVARMLHAIGRAADALRVLREDVLPVQIATFGAEHPEVACTKILMARYLTAWLTSLGVPADTLQQLKQRDGC